MVWELVRHLILKLYIPVRRHDIVKNIFMELDDDLDNLITDESLDFSCDNKGYENTENCY